MLRKALALGLALVVLWSGFATQEIQQPPASGSSDVAALSSDAIGGSVFHHHLDDPPAPFVCEGLADGAGLMATLADTSLPVRRSTRPADSVRHGVKAPFLAGLLRPPSITPV